MSRSEYYEEMKKLAREVRRELGLTTPRVLRSDLRRVYKAYDLRIDLRTGFKGLRGAYFNDECGASVVMAKGLPPDPAVFTMAHELKHHLVDSENTNLDCNKWNNPIEIAAEVFAAELVYPEQDFLDDLSKMGVERRCCSPEDLVRLKHNTRTTLSYAGLVKRAEWFNFIDDGQFAKVQFQKLHDQIYGPPFRRTRRM